MEKKVVQDPVSGRFIWKEVDENGSSTGVRSEGDFATETEAMEDAGIIPATPEVAEESVEETDDSTLEESAPAGDEESVLKEYEGPMGYFKITGVAPYTDEKGEKQGELEIGSIQHLPLPVGEMFVADGVAEAVDEPVSEGVSGETPDQESTE